MLAYELYLKNKDLKSSIPVDPYPIKKIFAVFKPKKSIKIDNKPLEEYGGKYCAKNKEIQDLFSMPCNNQREVGLPDERTGSSASSPYLIINGMLNTTKGNTCSLSLVVKGYKHSVGNKKGEKSEHKFVFDLKNDTPVAFEGAEKLRLRLNKKNYFIGNVNLFDKYIEAGILENDGLLSPHVTFAICEEFCNFARERIKNAECEIPTGLFKIVVLPEDNEVTYRPDKTTEQGNGQKFQDSFGVEVKSYASRTTKNAKFLSWDDPAFALNLSSDTNFYKNLGIGDETHEKINFLSDYEFEINRLKWYFLDLNSPDSEFINRDTSSGLYGKLLDNYKTMSRRSGYIGTLKIVCVRSTQSKQEILINENIPIKKLYEILLIDYSNKDSYHFLFEDTLLDAEASTGAGQANKKVVWQNYLYCIRNWLLGLPVERDYLLRVFSKRVRKVVMDYISNKNNQNRAKDLEEIKKINDFFNKAAICTKILTKNGRGDDMDKNEEYAYNIGKIVGKYIALKRKAGETTSSTEDLLTYSNYDREKLRFAFTKVSLGLSLSKSEALKEEMESFIKSNLQSEEISDEDSMKDYSYFFYKGVFSCLRGGFNGN